MGGVQKHRPSAWEPKLLPLYHRGLESRRKLLLLVKRLLSWYTFPLQCTAVANIEAAIWGVSGHLGDLKLCYL